MLTVLQNRVKPVALRELPSRAKLRSAKVLPT
jgi:hypothetical protein